MFPFFGKTASAAAPTTTREEGQSGGPDSVSRRSRGRSRLTADASAEAGEGRTAPAVSPRAVAVSLPHERDARRHARDAAEEGEEQEQANDSPVRKPRKHARSAPQTEEEGEEQPSRRKGGAERPSKSREKRVVRVKAQDADVYRDPTLSDSEASGRESGRGRPSSRRTRAAEVARDEDPVPLDSDAETESGEGVRARPSSSGKRREERGRAERRADGVGKYGQGGGGQQRRGSTSGSGKRRPASASASSRALESGGGGGDVRSVRRSVSVTGHVKRNKDGTPLPLPDFIVVSMLTSDGYAVATVVGKDGRPIAVATDEEGDVMVDADYQPIPLDKEGNPAPLGSDGKVLKPLQPVPIFTMFMVAGCLAGFGMSLWTTGGIAPLAINPTVGPTAQAMVACGAKVTYLIAGPAQEWWRLVTPLWLHSGLIHLASNMFLLWRYGQVLELSAGIVKYSTLYIASGIFSVAVSAAFAPAAITVGASGAIFGIFGAFLAELIQNWHLIPTRKQRCLAFTSLFLSLGLNLVIGLLPFIDNYAHLGGLVAGVLLGFPMLVYTRKDDKGRGCTTAQWAIGAAGVVAYLVLLAGCLISIANQWSLLQYCPECKYASCVPTPWWDCPDVSGIAPGFGPSPSPTRTPSSTPTRRASTGGRGVMDTSEVASAAFAWAVAAATSTPLPGWGGGGATQGWGG